MSGGDVYTESLEQRIERIRKRDEEIEKKHREVEADRLAALQANALVKTTAPNDEDWPKAHKYDNLDFTYDVKGEKFEESKKKSSIDEIRLNRQFKKFPEGQGPPADPTYNFLADAERDGKVTPSDKTNDNKKDWRGNNNNNETGTGLNRRSSYNNNSFNRGKSGAKAKTTNTKAKQQNSIDDTSSRKSDSDRSSCDEKVKRTKSIEGNWREKSIEEKKNDSDKNETKLSDGQKKSKINQWRTSTDSSPKAANKLSIQQKLGSKPEKSSDLSIEKRGNITVSITKDGEVKSVKLEATRAIGSGRVGAMRPAPVLEQAFEPPTLVSNTPTIIDSNLNALNLNNDINYQQYQLKSQQRQQPANIPVSSNIVNGVPFKLPSIQERLTKNRIFFDDKLKNNAIMNENANN